MYRVFPYLRQASSSNDPGHPLYVHEGVATGRLDNPAYFSTRYFALEPPGAIGEVFGDLEYWSQSMFQFPALPGANRALGTYSVSDDLNVLDLDDARNLLNRGLRPTQVVERNRSASSAWAKDIWEERGPNGYRAWAGVRWWSYHRPAWRVLGVWGQLSLDVVDVAVLSIDHPAVRDAARSLSKRFA